MRLFRDFIWVGILLGVLYSCSPLKKIESSQNMALATYASKDYSQAYSQLQTVINSYTSAKIKVPYDVVVKTADCAVQLGNFNEAVDYYAQAVSDSISVEGVKGYINSLAQLARSSQVSEALTKYNTFLDKEGEIDYVTNMQFAIALSSADDKAIIDLFPKLKETNEEQSMAYVRALENAGKEDEALVFCNKVIKETPSYDRLKEWKAVYYYNIAENEYKALMDAYNKNKNYTAYVYLKRDLKKVSANYRVAKLLFEELRQKDSAEKKYIKYLKNIYLRLELNREAAAMDELLK